MILRVPGIGLKSANRIVSLRRRGRIRFEHLKQMGVVISRAQPFIRCDGLPTSQWKAATPADKFSAAQDRAAAGTAALRQQRLVFVVEKTFEGLLTALFEAYAGKQRPDAIEPASLKQPELFDRRLTIATDPDKSDRVWKGLRSHLGSKRRQMLYEAYLSGQSGVETMICQLVWDAIPGRNHSQSQTRLSSHIQVEKLSQKVRREAHRMKGFIRFQQTGQDQYLALIAPHYDVLPLIRRHFESRFADQKWIIYDKLRNYGLCYDRHHAHELRLDAADLKASCNERHGDEQLCQSLWQRYYAAVNIPQRNNPRLHLRQLPRRYWRYLPEKQG